MTNSSNNNPNQNPFGNFANPDFFKLNTKPETVAKVGISTGLIVAGIIVLILVIR